MTNTKNTKQYSNSIFLPIDVSTFQEIFRTKPECICTVNPLNLEPIDVSAQHWYSQPNHNDFIVLHIHFKFTLIYVRNSKEKILTARLQWMFKCCWTISLAPNNVSNFQKRHPAKPQWILKSAVHPFNLVSINVGCAVQPLNLAPINLATLRENYQTTHEWIIKSSVHTFNLAPIQC